MWGGGGLENIGDEGETGMILEAALFSFFSVCRKWQHNSYCQLEGFDL